ncbi:alpha/beta fold hydrolase [Pseudohalocynthiibacter aestuariivivens]|jgi:pimeloyl-ACP methyl ester carboxylesterase|uniref:Alpha/beta fold hydrolase n=1 Tax=Pseudohalocynthiibacter aestuariivivens TaxID=1591409 RepID=A0ABV5JJN5_9RHOB|nr:MULTISPECIES: alpha/beta hydrolase [Pseudohalocynthiibacter]MBS9717548.1 alpha/beta hydrolase [Pseudohalocynthiibacter aestuariivivens]MCK0102733.1 alpha/beta hydrolase [Pseudohalocynthiibacter sp. F2068]
MTKTAPLASIRREARAPLVLVHGYLGGAAQWEAQLDALSPYLDVITPELTGYGSSWARDGQDSIAGFAQQVLADLTEQDIGRFHLLGHSMGGMIVQQMVSMAPERVDRLICYGTGPRGILPDRFETIEVSRARVRAEGVPDTAQRIAATWFAQGDQAAGYPMCVQLGEKVSEQTALGGLTAMENWDGRAALAHITQKTLVIWGDRDRSYGWAQPQALWRGIPDSSLCVLPSCAHAAHLEEPALFNQIVARFLKEAY